MKIQFIIALCLVFALESCEGGLLHTSSETLGSYSVNNPNFYVNISKVNGGATSSDVVQVRRVYKDSTYEIVKNIKDGDSILQFNCKTDTVNMIVRGRYWAQDINNDTIKFSVNDIFIEGRHKVTN